MLENKVWEVIEWDENIPQSDIIDSKWVFKHKLNTDGTIARYKSRLCARGFMQTHGVNYTETFAPVARYSPISLSYSQSLILKRFNTLRLMFAMASKRGWDIHQMDAKTAFLCAEIDISLYMRLPDGFDEIDTNPQRNHGLKRPILKILKGIYGIKQAPRLWNERLKQFLRDDGFVKYEYDHSLWLKGDLAVLVYVDDLLIVGPSSASTITDFKRRISETFKMSDMGLVNNFLGLQVVRLQEESTSSIGYGLHQAHYITKILEEYSMTDCKETDAPMPSQCCHIKRQVALDRGLVDNSAKPTEKVRYQRLVGSLMYLMLGTRPNIAFALSHLAQFASDPSIAHWKGLKRILRYLKGSFSSL